MLNHKVTLPARSVTEYEFSERMQQGKYGDKKKARAALKQEMQGKRYLILPVTTVSNSTKFRSRHVVTCMHNNVRVAVNNDCSDIM